MPLAFLVLNGVCSAFVWARGRLKRPKTVVSGPDRLLKDCRHRNIVRFEHFFWSPSVVYIVTEWCGLGDLAQFCARHRQPAQAADPAAWERTALDLDSWRRRCASCGRATSCIWTSSRKICCSSGARAGDPTSPARPRASQPAPRCAPFTPSGTQRRQPCVRAHRTGISQISSRCLSCLNNCLL